MQQPTPVRFDFRVTNPEQRKGSGALDRPYWVYHVFCQTTSDRYPCKTPQCVRRYKDFEWLRGQLTDEFPWCILPPVPGKDFTGTLEKFVGQQGTSNSQLLEYRQRGLFKFLIRLGSHPQLQQSQALQDFLEMDESEWERRMQAPPTNKDPQLSALQNLVTVAAPPSQASQALPSSQTIWHETRLYVGQLQVALETLQGRLQHLVMRRRSTSHSLSHFGQAFQHVGRIETELESREETPLVRAVKAVGQHTGELSTIYAEHADEETQRVVETAMYYVGMCESVTDALKRLEAWTKRREKAVKDNREALASRDKAIAKGGGADKVQKAEAALKESQQHRVQTERQVAAMEEAFRDEFRRFHREKQYDMKAILKSFVDLQMDYADKMKRSWEALLPTVEEVKL